MSVSPCPVQAHSLEGNWWLTGANFSKIGQFEILQPPPAGQMFLQLYSSDKQINQSILAGRQEQVGPSFDHQSLFLAKKKYSCWSLTINCISAGF